MHLFATIKGTLGALIGHGWKSVSLGLLLAFLGLSAYTTMLKHQLAPPDKVEQLKQNVQTGQEVQKSTERARKSNERLNHVLESNKDWSDRRVPDDVVNGLCSKVRCG